MCASIAAVAKSIALFSRQIYDITVPVILSLCALFLACQESTKPVSEASEIYKNSDYSVDARVKDLLSRMTLEEKIGQMMQVERNYLQAAEDIRTYYIGSVLSGGGSVPTPNEPSAWADMVDNYQTRALATRLGIPLIYGIDAVHGHSNVYGAVIFPHNIGLGCSGDPQLVEQAARATAEEVAGTGIHWTFSPCIAVVRDERWGRTYEGFGETPELSEMMSAAAVTGYQSDNLADNSAILACPKHFLGDGGTTGGHDQGNTEADETTMRQIHLPGYIAAIEAGVGSIMVSFSSWNGQKMHGSYYWLTTVLKGELGFEGFVVSDWGGIDQLPRDFASDIATAVNAGIDMIMLPHRYQDFRSTTLDLVASGQISITRIDDAVSRILRIKLQLGLFESPYADRSLTATIGSAAHRDIARQCVRKSLVLLKNENDCLPIADSVSHILVAGKNADDLGHQCGGWTITWQGASGDITIGTTVYEAICERAGPEVEVTYSSDGSNAAGADLGIVVIGEAPYAEGAGDRSDLALAAEDVAVVNAVYETGIPTVIILISGRPLLINNVLGCCAAFIAAWLPGTEGMGIADILFGDYTPTGKLSHSWPVSMEQIPINAGDSDYKPLFPYGYGLAY